MGAVADLSEIMIPKIEEARKEGRQEGIEKGIEKTAASMLKKGFSISDISEITGLPIEKIKSLSGR